LTSHKLKAEECPIIVKYSQKTQATLCIKTIIYQIYLVFQVKLVFGGR